MCGLAGRINPSGAGEQVLHRGMKWLARRGPDHQGSWVSNDRKVELIHTRLSTVDPKPRSNQPFIDADNDLVIVFNGDIYNFRELRHRYSNFDYHTESDTETIIAAYVDEGVQSFKHFRGTFALALVDGRRGVVVLARDPIGKKPLYVAHWGEEVLFGSSILPLVSAHGVAVDIDDDSARDFWEAGFVRPHRSILRGIIPVMPGQVITLDLGGRICAQSNCVPAGEHLYAGESVDEVNTVVRAYIKRAVHSRIPTDSNPVLTLSGGIDSTVVCQSFADQYDEPLRPAKALTLGSLVPLTNDEPYARYAARKVGLPLYVARPHSLRIHDEIIQSLNAQDEPLGNVSYFALFYILKQIKSFGRFVLCGDGGDEMFCGFDQIDKWKNGPAPWAPSEIHSGPPSPAWMGGWGRYASNEALIGDGFTKTDRAASEQAVVMRAPLLDWDLVSYVRSLPPDILFGNGQSKAILKQQLSQWPRWFVQRKKGGFAYNLRWFWAASNFTGMRDNIDPEAQQRFDTVLASPLKQRADKWTRRDIFSNFWEAWKLLAWSTFEQKLKAAGEGRYIDI